MPKKLLSPELARVLKDLEAARIAINEKYEANGSPDALLPPMLSGDLAEAIRAITCVGELPVLNGEVEVSVEHKENTLPSGYYKDGVHAFLKDYAIGYIWNRQDIPARTRYVGLNQSFVIPDFEEEEPDLKEIIERVANTNGEEFMGWSHMPDDEDPEYETGDYVPNFQYEPKLEDSSYITYLYAVWKLLKLNPITLSFEYKNGGKLDADGKEVIKMKVSGQSIDFPGLQRTYEVEGNPETKEDIEIGSDWYKHQFTFHEVGVFPVVVTHTGKKGDPEIAAGVMKVLGANGSLSDSGSMDVHNGYGSWYDSKWVSHSIMKGIYISSLKFEVQFHGHGGGEDALAVFVKKTNGDEYVIWDMGNEQERQVDLTTLGTTTMINGTPESPITLGSVTLQRSDLSSEHHYIPGPSSTKVINFTKADDIRQVRFFVFSSHDNPNCMSNALINYDINYEFDMDLWKSDKASLS